MKNAPQNLAGEILYINRQEHLGCVIIAYRIKIHRYKGKNNNDSYN